jgi:hypothetical protein
LLPAPVLDPSDTGGTGAAPVAGVRPSAVVGSPLSQAATASVTTATPGAPRSQTIAELVHAHVPHSVLLLQLLVATLLALFLARSWLTSWQLARES